jgi:hypothetical protein
MPDNNAKVGVQLVWENLPEFIQQGKDSVVTALQGVSAPRNPLHPDQRQSGYGLEATEGNYQLFERTGGGGGPRSEAFVHPGVGPGGGATPGPGGGGTFSIQRVESIQIINAGNVTITGGGAGGGGGGGGRGAGGGEARRFVATDFEGTPQETLVRQLMQSGNANTRADAERMASTLAGSGGGGGGGGGFSPPWTGNPSWEASRGGYHPFGGTPSAAEVDRLMARNATGRSTPGPHGYAADEIAAMQAAQANDQYKAMAADFAQQQAEAGARGPGFLQQFGQNVFGGIPGIGQAMAGAAAPVALAAAAGYAAHVGMQTVQAALTPEAAMRGVSPEAYGASLLRPIGGVPILGVPFQLGAERLEALGRIRDTAAELRIRAPGFGWDTGGLAEASGQGIMDEVSRGFALGGVTGAIAMPIGLGIRRAFGFGPQGITGMRGQDVSENLARLASGDPFLGQQAATAMLQAAATRAGGRPAAYNAEISATMETLAMRQHDVDLVEGSLRGGGVTVGEARHLAEEAVGAGDINALIAMRGGMLGSGRRITETVDIDGAIRRAARIGHLRLETQVAGAEVGLAGAAVTRAQATFRPLSERMQALEATSPLIGEMAESIQRQIDATPADTPTNRLRRLELEAQRQGFLTQQARVPFERVQATMEAGLAVAGATGTEAQASLAVIQARGLLPGVGMERAFVRQREAQGAEARALQTAIDRMRNLGAGEETIAPLRGQLAQVQAQQQVQGLTETNVRFQAGAAPGEAITRGGQAAYSFAAGTQFGFSTEAASAAQTIQQGFGIQIQAALRKLREDLANPRAGPGVIASDQAMLTELQSAARQAATQAARQAAQDLISVASTPGAVAGSFLGVVGAGVVPQAAIPGLLGQQAGSMQATLGQMQQARSAAISRGDFVAANQLDREIAGMQAQMMVLPLQQTQALFQLPMMGAAAQTSEATVGAQYAAMTGRGGMDLVNARQQEATSQAAEIALKRAALERDISASAAAGNPLAPEAVAARRAEINRDVLRQRQTQLGAFQYQPSVQRQETMSQAQYEMQVLETVPGAFGNIRRAGMQIMSELGGQMGEIEQNIGATRRRTDLTPQERAQVEHGLMEQERGLGLRQAQTMQQLSWGWQGRLISETLGTPGNFGLIASRFSLRDAVGAGVENPMFGSTAGNLQNYMRFAGLVRQPGRLPGQAGAFPSDDFGVFGMPGMPGGRGGGGGVTGGAGMAAHGPAASFGVYGFPGTHGGPAAGPAVRVSGKVDVTVRLPGGAVVGTGTADLNPAAGDSTPKQNKGPTGSGADDVRNLLAGSGVGFGQNY